MGLWCCCNHIYNYCYMDTNATTSTVASTMITNNNSCKTNMIAIITYHFNGGGRAIGLACVLLWVDGNWEPNHIWLRYLSHWFITTLPIHAGLHVIMSWVYPWVGSKNFRVSVSFIGLGWVSATSCQTYSFIYIGRYSAVWERFFVCGQ